MIEKGACAVVREVLAHNGIRYIRRMPGEAQMAAPEDGRALAEACFEEDINLVLIPGGCLAPSFFRLATGTAGEVLQKLSNYNLRAAAVIDPSQIRGKFRDFLVETNRGGTFRAFSDEESAAAWLTAGADRDQP